jgi:hypothetical protein
MTGKITGMIIDQWVRLLFGGVQRSGLALMKHQTEIISQLKGHRTDVALYFFKCGKQARISIGAVNIQR